MAASFRHGKTPAIGQTKSLSRTRSLILTTTLRKELEEAFLGDLLGEEPQNEPDGNERAEENKEANDHYRDDTVEEYDVAHATGGQDVASSLLACRPKAHWRVSLKGDDVSVEPIASSRRFCNSPLSERRMIVLTLAARKQRAYLATAEIDKLHVLEAKNLKEAIKDEQADPAIVASYAGRKVDIASDIRGQFFYTPWGELHAVSFLFQHDTYGGIAVARVCQALASIVTAERESRNVLTDHEVAYQLNARFGVSFFNGARVARWRETKSESSTRELYFPAREERMGYAN